MDALRAVVGSEARARVLTALFSEPGRAFYQKELQRAADVPLVAVQRQLKRLVDAGVLVAASASGRRVYTANPRSAVHDELSAIVRKLRGPTSVIRSALAVRRSVDLAFVFGSFASGSATASSDIDLMILTTESPRLIRTALAPAERDLHRSVNEYTLTTAEWKSRLQKSDPFLTNVRREPKLWVVGDDETLAKLDPQIRR